MLRLLQDSSGQHAFVGMGFEDRGDAFDFNVALQDHFKWVVYFILPGEPPDGSIRFELRFELRLGHFFM